MTPDERDLEARVRAALYDEAGELWPPTTLWPRVQARLAQPIEGSPPLVRSPGELRRLLCRDDLRGLTLALLAEREMEAFALARRADDVARAVRRSPLHEGALLPVLHALEVDGLVVARWRAGPHGLRRAYSLSARGRRQRRRAPLLGWLARLGWRIGRLIPRRTIGREQRGRT